MKVLFYLGHPAHFHLFKNLFKVLERNNDQIFITIKTKDILEELLIESGYTYENIYPAIRKQSKFSILSALLIKNSKLIRIALKFKPDLMLGTSIEIAEVGRLLGIPTAIVNEDDHDVVPQFAKLGYPFTDFIIAPECCRVGKWTYKKVSYQSYHELAYLSPQYFKPNQNTLKKYNLNDQRFFIMRFSQLRAYHDQRITGITGDLAKDILARLEKHGKVFITSENKLESALEKYRLKINPRDIHDIMAFADLYIGDSQTMAAEAAVLGTPSLRYNDFVGRIGYLDELEFKHNLTFGIKTEEPEKLLEKIDELLSKKDLKSQWQLKAKKMLESKVDLTLLLFWFIHFFPESGKVLKKEKGFYSEKLLDKNFVDTYNNLMHLN